MLQAFTHSHADLIFLSGGNNPLMESIDDEDRVAHRKAMGERITQLRKAAGLSQPQLAASVGIAQPSLSTIESGKTVEVSARTLISICRALETTIEYVWDGIGADEEDMHREAQLVAIYRELPEHGRLAVLQSARAVRDATMPPPSPTPPKADDRLNIRRTPKGYEVANSTSKPPRRKSA